MNRIDFPVLTFFICIFKCKAGYMFLTGNMPRWRHEKRSIYSRKFSFSKIFLGRVSGKTWRVFFLPWRRITCQISHCIGAWNPWKLDKNEKQSTSQGKREVTFNLHHSLSQGQNRLKQFPTPGPKGLDFFRKLPREMVTCKTDPLKRSKPYV